jgi:lysyl-tRNA synthetase class 2
MDETNHLIQERIKKLNELKEKGINPFPYSYNQTHHAVQIKEKYGHLKAEEKTNDKAKVAGRIMQVRDMGKAAFMHLQDETGRIQLYLRQDDIGAENYKLIKKLDIGDIIGAEGIIFKTKTGETSIYVQNYELLCKGIRPLPEKFHGLTDVETRYRQRYVDLIMNQDVKEVFKKRAIMIQSIRNTLSEKGFIEVETPTLQTQYGGAEAKPFKTHINAWNMDMFLSISPELFLKRLLVGGFEKVYTICKNFRNEGVDKTHNPEFTMLEVYWAYKDYNDMMDLLEEIYEKACIAVNGTTKMKAEYRSEEHTSELQSP